MMNKHAGIFADKLKPKKQPKGLAPFGIPFIKYRFPAAAILAVWFIAAYAGLAGAVVIESDPDLQRVMGDLYAMSGAMRLFYEDTHKTSCPSLDELAHYIKKPLPENWAADYRTTGIQGDWWVGRKVPEFSAARKFLREKASSLGLYDLNTQSEWLGGSFVWMSAVTFGGKEEKTDKNVFKAAQGEGGDNQHLFFNSPGTSYYWRSSLIYTTGAHAALLKNFAADDKGPFVVPAASSPAQEALTASPVELPPDFTLGGGEETIETINMGDVTINPIPQQPSE